MNLINKKILVTGADGFIGSLLTEELQKLGCNVRAFVLYNSFNSWGWLDYTPKSLQDNLEIFSGDIRDSHGVQEAMKGCEVVIHQRKIKLGSTHPTRDFNYVKDTVKGFITVAESDASVGKVINIGSNYEISIGVLVRLIAEIIQAWCL